MNLPFISRKNHEAAVQELTNIIQREQSRTDFVANQAEELRRDLDQLKAERDAAFSLGESLNLIALSLAKNTEAVAQAADRMAHSIGAQAIAQHKAADVQREWLEISKGNR